MNLRNDEIALAKAIGLPLCDFCVRDFPAVRFPQKRPFIAVWPDGRVDVYEEPWSACEACAPLVERKQLHLLLDRVIRLSPAFSEMSRADRDLTRRLVKKLYRAMYDAGVQRPERLEGGQL